MSDNNIFNTSDILSGTSTLSWNSECSSLYLTAEENSSSQSFGNISTSEQCEQRHLNADNNNSKKATVKKSYSFKNTSRSQNESIKFTPNNIIASSTPKTKMIPNSRFIKINPAVRVYRQNATLGLQVPNNSCDDPAKNATLTQETINDSFNNYPPKAVFRQNAILTQQYLNDSLKNYPETPAIRQNATLTQQALNNTHDNYPPTALFRQNAILTPQYLNDSLKNYATKQNFPESNF